jgi:hypothetical protein
MPDVRARRLGLVAAVIAGATLVTACGNLDPARGVLITEPLDGNTVTSPFVVRFDVKGLQVAPAGDIMANTGHYILIVDADAVPRGEVVPISDRHIHLSKGQKETQVSLPPGRYRLTAQFADGAYRSYGPALSRTISVTVK